MPKQEDTISDHKQKGSPDAALDGSEKTSKRAKRRSADQFYTPPELARILRVDVMKIHRWINRGELSAVNVAGFGTTRPRWRIPPTAWDDFLLVQRNRPATPTPKKRRPVDRTVIEFY